MIGVLGGKLIHRVRLQSRVESSRGSSGGIIESWTTDDTLWANVRPVSGRERIAGLQLAASTTHIVRLRFNATITPKHRLQHDIRGKEGFLLSDTSPWTTVKSLIDQPFTADMVGQYLTITSGTNFILGDYRIVTFTATNEIVVDSPVATQNVTFGVSDVNRQLHITDVIDVEEDKVTTELHCVERND